MLRMVNTGHMYTVYNIYIYIVRYVALLVHPMTSNSRMSAVQSLEQWQQEVPSIIKKHNRSIDLTVNNTLEVLGRLRGVLLGYFWPSSGEKKIISSHFHPSCYIFIYCKLVQHRAMVFQPPRIRLTTYKLTSHLNMTPTTRQLFSLK